MPKPFDFQSPDHPMTRSPDHLLTYSFVIPAYNESVRIRPTLHALLRYVQEQNWDAEILVVNDGSTDDTAQIVREYGKSHPQVLLVENPGNRGKGYSVRNGMLHARGDICLFTDADLSSPITEAQKLFDAIARGADIAIGSRWLRWNCRPSASPCTGRRLDESSISCCGCFWACVSRTRNADSKLFGETPRSASFRCRKLNAGDSIRRFCFWRGARACGWKRFRCCGRTAKGRGCILSATDCACSWKFCGFGGMR
jgi:glycosyltransferase involved in cell wall biosynthesis